jgi:hypothetical protein
MMTETISAPGNPGATKSVANDGPAFELPAELREAPATDAAKTPDQAEAQPAQDPAQDSAEKNPEAAKTDDKPEKDKPRSPVQQRIDELTRGKRDAERRAAQALSDLHRAQTRLQEREAKLDPNDFNATENFRVEKAVANGRIEDTYAEAERQIAEAAAKRSEVFTAKVEEARASIPDIEQKLQAFARVPVTDFGASFIAESAAAVQIAAHLADHPQEAVRIARMPEGQQGIELARLEAKLTAPPVRRISQAPTPVPTLGGSRSPAVKDPADMSVSELSAVLYRKGA